MDYETKLELVKSHNDAKLPQQSQDDVGWDVFAVEDSYINPGEVGKVNTGIKFAKNPMAPSKTELFGAGPMAPVAHDKRWSIETKIEGRSGMASRGIWPVGGVVDPRYRGEIIVCLFNSTKEVYKVNKEDKIAQLVLRPVLANTKNHKVEFTFVDKQEETDRGSKGFGSSGK